MSFVVLLLVFVKRKNLLITYNHLFFPGIADFGCFLAIRPSRNDPFRFFLAASKTGL